MNNLLSYNIASEPSIFNDNHRYPLVDSTTYSYIGEEMNYDNFRNPVSILAPYTYVFTLIFTICFTIITVHKLKSYCLKIFTSICFIIGMSIFVYTFRKEYTSLHVCSIPWKCYEGVNETIDYSLNYYISSDECYSITNLGYEYADRNRVGEEWSCKTFKYGCCSIDVNCINAVKNDWNYDLIELEDVGHMNIPLKKDDILGSNCPNVNSLIESKINSELYLHYKRYLGMCLISLIGYISLYLPCISSGIDYEKTDNSVLP